MSALLYHPQEPAEAEMEGQERFRCRYRCPSERSRSPPDCCCTIVVVMITIRTGQWTEIVPRFYPTQTLSNSKPRSCREFGEVQSDVEDGVEMRSRCKQGSAEQAVDNIGGGGEGGIDKEVREKGNAPGTCKREQGADRNKWLPTTPTLTCRPLPYFLSQTTPPPPAPTPALRAALSLPTQCYGCGVQTTGGAWAQRSIERGPVATQPSRPPCMPMRSLRDAARSRRQPSNHPACRTKIYITKDCLTACRLLIHPKKMIRAVPVRKQ